MNEKPTINLHTLKPITKFIYTIGALPTSYLMSMSYPEQLTWLCNYIMQTLIPNLNENTEAVQELQELYDLLRQYVNDYFDNLDVQEEINNKLDKMAQNGELINLIKDYVDPFINTQNDVINTFKSQVNSEIDELDTKIEAATSGSPLVATSTSGMTDTTRVYVNTTDGKWYYYDGDSWEIGGVYQSATLTYDYDLQTNNAIPNSKTVGNYIENIEENMLNLNYNMLPLKTVEDGHYYNASTGKQTAGTYEAITLDVSKLAGYEIEITAYQDSAASTVLFGANDDIILGFQQNGKSSVIVMPTVKKIGISNKKANGSFVVNVKRKKSTENIYKFAYNENVLSDYTKWNALINATEKTTYSNKFIAYLTNAVSNNGYLTLKVASLKDTAIKIIQLSSTGLIKDIYSALIYEGVNEIETPLYFTTTDLVGFEFDDTSVMQYTNVGNTWKGIPVTALFKSYVGATMDLSSGTTFNNGLIIDYKISTFNKINLNDIEQKENTDLSSLMRSDNELHIKIIGDSITAGYGIGSTNSWAGQFITYFNSLYPSMTITNVAQSGQNSTWVVNNLSTLISDSDDVVMLMIGTNNRNSQAAFNVLYSDLSTIKQYCDTKNIKLIIITPPISALNGTEGENKGGRYCHMDKIVHEITAWCENNNKDFIDCYETLYDMILTSGNNIDDYFIDGLHPTTDTSYLLFRIICKGINMYAKIKNGSW